MSLAGGCVVVDDYEALSRRAAEFVVEEVRRRADLLLCAATGGTPTGMYDRLAERATEDARLFAKMRVIKLDEWGGLAMDDPATCEVYVQRKLVRPLGIGGDRYMAFKSDAADPQAECRRISGQLAEAGPIDVCILGLGANGHLALNEPGEAVRPFAHVAELSKSSLGHAMLKEARGEAKYGLTLGMGDILQSRRVLMLVSGEHKREMMKRFLRPEVTPRFPASLLWLHGDVTCICDRAAMEG